ncbi:MAG TPA: cob(I)yrinic acid a,c-diamide adenosyltransferase [Candidatus Latescibacteria bacterium]|nr:cob(I)yrinic acid a,c-diamide adenosyltransferase [Candidatus Latescibacterota bacterium]
MVNLTKIYTRAGDGGNTHLGDGSKVRKTDLRVEAMGAVDELNAILGVVISLCPEGELDRIGRQIQNDLFDVGADLCRPPITAEQDGEVLLLDAGKPDSLERWIDQFNAGLSPLRSFVLPGGTPVAAQLHHTRTVCRRAERRVIALRDEGEGVSTTVITYLNRLSDLLFVLAREKNDAGQADILWAPGNEPQ